jgi:hypothetical protein
MKLTDVEWATITDAAHSLASEPRALPEERIEREIIRAIWLGRFGVRGIRIPPPFDYAVIRTYTSSARGIRQPSRDLQWWQRRIYT